MSSRATHALLRTVPDTTAPAAPTPAAQRPSRARTDSATPVTDTAADTPALGVGGHPQPATGFIIGIAFGLAFWAAVVIIATSGNTSTILAAAVAAGCLLLLPILIVALIAGTERFFPRAADHLAHVLEGRDDEAAARFALYRPGRLVEVAPVVSPCSKCDGPVERNGLCVFHWERWVQDTYDASWDPGDEF